MLIYNTTIHFGLDHIESDGNNMAVYIADLDTGEIYIGHATVRAYELYVSFDDAIELAMKDAVSQLIAKLKSKDLACQFEDYTSDDDDGGEDYDEDGDDDM